MQRAYWSFDDKSCVSVNNVNWGTSVIPIYYFKVFEGQFKDNLPKHISIDGGKDDLLFFMQGIIYHLCLYTCR